MNQTTETAPLTEQELTELDRFLSSDATSDQTMMIDAVDGYLTAVVLGPGEVNVDRWLPGIWGPDVSHAPKFRDDAQAQRINQLLIRHCQGIATVLDQTPDCFEPILDMVSYQNKSREYLDGEMWSYGFIQGISLARQAWQPLFENDSAMDALLPIYVLGADDITAEQKALIDTPAKREALAQQIAASVATLWRFWHPQHQPSGAPVSTGSVPLQRSEPKTGRNDPCPCGSGKKFKKCCGSPERLH
ncbi:MAG: YecA family protein [Rhodocyclaceae bacterium]|nr:YecA family protein [Rhodocyclaceae bacterium]